MWLVQLRNWIFVSLNFDLNGHMWIMTTKLDMTSLNSNLPWQQWGHLVLTLVFWHRSLLRGNMDCWKNGWTPGLGKRGYKIGLEHLIVTEGRGTYFKKWWWHVKKNKQKPKSLFEQASLPLVKSGALWASEELTVMNPVKKKIGSHQSILMRKRERKRMGGTEREKGILLHRVGFWLM